MPKPSKNRSKRRKLRADEDLKKPNQQLLELTEEDFKDAVAHGELVRQKGNKPQLYTQYSEDGDFLRSNVSVHIIKDED